MIILSLESLLNSNSSFKKIGISNERIEAVKPELRKRIAFWREYPDLFVDFMQTGGDPEKAKNLSFHLYSYQRIFLRVAMRYKYVYCVFPRAFSKSFLAVLIMMIRCILFPGAHLFYTAGGKEQASSILSDKVADICDKIPAFKNEIDWTRGGGTTVSKDHCKYVFKNGSDIENVAANERSRGRRKHAGVLEECVGIDQKILQEVIIPLMNVPRKCLDGTYQEDEPLSQSQLYITTAGYKQTYAYEKLIQTLVQMIIEPEKAFVMGGTFKVPIILGLQNKSFLKDLKNDPTFNPASFDREYNSRWSGTVENAFFDGERFDRNRIINQPEYQYSGRSSDRTYYILGVDVARTKCQTVITVVKVNPQVDGTSLKNVVAIYAYEAEHFQKQAILIKKLFYKYKARRVVIDGMGLGVGLMDFMVIEQKLEDESIYPPFGVMGGSYKDAAESYKKYRTDNTEDDAIYVVKADTPFNSAMYSCLQSQIDSGKIKFLIEQREAKAKLLSKKVGQNMRPEQREEYLFPFSLTDILKEEMLNLREETSDGYNIRLKGANKSIGHDKVSSLGYAIYYIREIEDSKKRKKKSKFSQMMFMG